jgi:phage terminase large subunit-like protein
VPVVEVEDAIRAACTRWRVLEVAADSYRWVRSLELLDGAGILVGEYRSHRPGWPGTSRFSAAVVDRLLTHDGSSALARHAANTILKEELRGARLAKEHKDSKRRIDAAVMAHDRAAILAGEVGPAIYVLD